MGWLDWNSMVNSRHGMTFSLKGPYKFIYLLSMKKNIFVLFIITFSSLSYADYLNTWSNNDLCGWTTSTSIPKYMSDEIIKRDISCSNGAEIIVVTINDETNINLLSDLPKKEEALMDEELTTYPAPSYSTGPVTTAIDPAMPSDYPAPSYSAGPVTTAIAPAMPSDYPAPSYSAGVTLNAEPYQGENGTIFPSPSNPVAISSDYPATSYSAGAAPTSAAPAAAPSMPSDYPAPAYD